MISACRSLRVTPAPPDSPSKTIKPQMLSKSFSEAVLYFIKTSFATTTSLESASSSLQISDGYPPMFFLNHSMSVASCLKY